MKVYFGAGTAYLATLFINLTGCFLIAYISSLPKIHPNARLCLTTGFCGAYTTFSTYALDTRLLIDSRQTGIAFNYWLGSIALGILFTYLGTLTARLHRP